MDKELYKQKIHQLVEKIKEDPELFSYLFTIVNNTECTSGFIKLQRKKLRQKGYMFYKEVNDNNLRNQLINDYAMMLWYKCTGDIPKMFSFVLFQIENMLNAFLLTEGSAVYKMIKENPDIYIYKYIYQNSKKEFTISAYDSFFTKKGDAQELEKISIWAKYTYWFVSTQQNNQFKNYTHSLISDIINFRNITEHRNSQKEIKKFLLDKIVYWETNIDSKFGYLDKLLSTIQSTVQQSLSTDR